MTTRSPPSPPAGVRPDGPPPAEDPFLRKVVWVLLATTVTGLLLTLLILGIEIVLVAFGGVLLAVLLSALTDLAARLVPLPRGWVYALVLVVLLLLLAGAGALLAPRVTAQVAELRQELPRMWSELQRFLGEQPWGAWADEQLTGGDLEERIEDSAGALFGGLTQSFTLLITVVFTALFSAASPGLYMQGITRLFPLRRRDRALEVLGQLGHTLRWWLIGRALAMTLVGISTAIVLLLLGVRFATLLGIMAGLFTFVPYLGPIVAGVPIVLVSLVEGPQTAVYALLLYTAVQLLEGYVLDPVLMHRLVYIPPVVTIVLQVLLGVVIGVVGIALATPLAAVLVVLVRVYREDILGEPPEDETQKEADEPKAAPPRAHRDGNGASVTA